jgi:hypothetical protein
MKDILKQEKTIMKKLIMKLLETLVLVCLLYIFSGLAVAGTLEPPDTAIDSNTGDPKPTMKTLDNIPGSWDRKLPANDGPDPCHSSRFTCVLPTTHAPDGAAVRDNETGLVWSRRVGPSGSFSDWASMALECEFHAVGGRNGWRLPLYEELASLFEPLPTGSLPDGHPFFSFFTPSTTGYFWTLSNSPTDSSHRIVLLMDFGTTGLPFMRSNPLSLHVDFQDGAAIWCVRGGTSINLTPVGP